MLDLPKDDIIEEVKDNDDWFDRLVAKLHISSQTFIIIVLTAAFLFSLVSGLYSINFAKRSQNEVLETQFNTRLETVERNTERIEVLEAAVRQNKTKISDLEKGILAVQNSIEIRVKPLDEFMTRQNEKNADIEDRFFRLESRPYK